MSDGIPMERMTPEEIARLKLRYTNRDGSAEVLCSKAWAHITLQGAEITRLTAEVEKLNKSRNKWGQKYNKLLEQRKVTVSQLKAAVWSDSEECKLLTAENEKLRATLEPLACTCDRPNGAACSRSEVDCPFWNARAALEEK